VNHGFYLDDGPIQLRGLNEDGTPERMKLKTLTMKPPAAATSG